MDLKKTITYRGYEIFQYDDIENNNIVIGIHDGQIEIGTFALSKDYASGKASGISGFIALDSFKEVIKDFCKELPKKEDPI